MPGADTVGAYELSLSYEGSLLEDPGVLSSAGVFALGIGNLAQIEYRHTSAIGIEGSNVPLPAVGVQLKLPLPETRFLPAVALAYRLGINHEEEAEMGAVTESVTDVFAAAHFRLPVDIHLHLALRLSQATLDFAGEETDRTLWLPAVGVTRDVSEKTSVVLELSMAPQFALDGQDLPAIDSGLTGRMGLRWRLHPRLILDASAGYLSSKASGSTKPLEWDIRLGGEIFIPWGALSCTALGLFCK
jgi:hypothetical protein